MEMMDDDVRRLAERAADVLQSYGWAQGVRQRATGEVCLTGAVAQAMHGHRDVTLAQLCKLRNRVERAVFGAEKRLGRRCGFTITGEPGEADWSALVHWNDEPGRTAEDVILAFKRAAANERASDD